MSDLGDLYIEPELSGPCLKCSEQKMNEWSYYLSKHVILESWIRKTVIDNVTKLSQEMMDDNA